MIVEEFGIELAPLSESAMSYTEAKMYCFTLTYDGKIGWRLPSYEEWEIIPHIAGWYENKMASDSTFPRRVTPVRDLR
jgi:hypothetical protein